MDHLQLFHGGFPFRQNIGCLTQACYCAALIEQTTETETPIPSVYTLFSQLLRHIQSQPAQAQTLFAFELRLLSELGLEPDLSDAHLTPGSKQIVKALSGPEWAVVSRLKLSEGQVSELAHFLHGFLIYNNKVRFFTCLEISNAVGEAKSLRTGERGRQRVGIVHLRRRSNLILFRATKRSGLQLRAGEWPERVHVSVDRGR